MEFCWASDATGISKSSPLFYNHLLPLNETVLRPKNHSKKCLEQRQDKGPTQGRSVRHPCSYFSPLGLVSLIEWGAHICGEDAQPKSSHEKMGLSMSPSVHNATSCLYWILYAVRSLGSGFALTSIFPCGFPSILALDTLFFSLKFFVSDKYLNLPIPMRCSCSTSDFLPLHQVLAKKCCSYTLFLSSLFHPLPNTQVLFYQKGSAPLPATFTTTSVPYHLLCRPSPT